tara:strand:+ start:17168 stop:17428 length:261 start_codon:yes stop_codon:yes gene_type:complete
VQGLRHPEIDRYSDFILHKVAQAYIDSQIDQNRIYGHLFQRKHLRTINNAKAPQSTKGLRNEPELISATARFGFPGTLLARFLFRV